LSMAASHLSRDESFSRCPWSGRTTVLGGLLVDSGLPLRI